MISSIIQAIFFIMIRPNMNEQEKKLQIIYDLLNAETKPKFFVFRIQRKENRNRAF